MGGGASRGAKTPATSPSATSAATTSAQGPSGPGSSSSSSSNNHSELDLAPPEREWLERERENEREYLLAQRLSERQQSLALDDDFLEEVSDDGMILDQQEDENRQSWGLVSNSLGMDRDDLLFNMLYFNPEGASLSMGAAINNAIEETVALHSASNTPYKLHPATPEDLQNLCGASSPYAGKGPGPGSFSPDKHQLRQQLRHHQQQQQQQRALLSPRAACADMSPRSDAEAHEGCSVCKEDFTAGCSVIALPNCSHIFHDDCLRKWLGYQNWCPVCRTEIGAAGSRSAPAAAGEEDIGIVGQGPSSNCSRWSKAQPGGTAERGAEAEVGAGKGVCREGCPPACLIVECDDSEERKDGNKDLG